MDRRWLKWCLWLAVLCLGGLRFVYLTADFPNGSPWGGDQAKFTDEGWWASGALAHRLTGHWTVPGDYNPVVALPVWPLLLDSVFRFTGVSIVAARALSVALSLATIGLVYALVRRYAKTPSVATLAALMLAASPFAFVFSRLAVLDTFVAFQFCVLLWTASCLSTRRWAPLAALVVLVPAIVLTKTTAVVLLPAVAWLAWRSMRANATPTRRLGALLAVTASSALLLKGHAALVVRLGFGEDYRYFFDVNSVPPFEWREAQGHLADLLRNCMWIDRVLYPLGLAAFVLAAVKLRRLWRNDLFAACWITLTCQAVFILSRQDEYAPRYFLAMLVPLIIVVALTLDALREGPRALYLGTMAAMAASLAINAVAIGSFLHRRTFQFYDAAASIAHTVRQDSRGNHRILSVSGSQLSLMTGLPAVCDAYGTEDLGAKLLVYRPGWYAVWNGMAPSDAPALAPFRIERIASYPAFDDDDRDQLILYRLTLKGEGPKDNTER